MNSLFHTNGVKSLINEFHYPVLGPGMMWETFQKLVEDKGGEVKLNCDVAGINSIDNRIKSITINNNGEEEEITGDYYISSMPVTELVKKMKSLPGEEILNSAGNLSYRSMILIGIVINEKQLFPDNWLYVHSPEFKVGRIQNFKNWSKEMCADENKTNIGMEYFCTEDDEIWSLSDVDLIKLAKEELKGLGISSPEKIEEAVVFRQSKAYPVYDHGFQDNLNILKEYLSQIENLQTIGRNGMHRYNNQDHSMLTAILAVRNLFGEEHDLWDVNTERSYYEEVVVEK